MKKEIRDKMVDVEFKREGLGALEFKYPIVNKEFEEKMVMFRIERTSLQTFTKINPDKGIENMLKQVLESFIALPVEARDLKYFEYSTGALTDISDICQEFQNTPLSFS